MKVAGNGQGKILTPEELRRLFTDGLRSPRDRALFGICLAALLADYQPKSGPLFPGMQGRSVTFWSQL